MRLKGILCATLAVVLGVFGASCSTSSSSSPGVSSGPGESCTRTADCQSGLLCIANVCGGSRAEAAEGGTAPDSGEVPPPPPEAGVEASPPQQDAGPLGRIGESCQTNHDCSAGLGCVPLSTGASVCDVVSYGLTASTKTCTGECSTATDCCDLPTGIGLSGRTDAGLFVSVLNCADILSILLNGNPSVCDGRPAAGTPADTGCFYYKAYCSCAANTWACNAGKCIYTASCQPNPTGAYGGCPPYTRTRTVLNTTCNAANSQCLSASSGCSMDADCEGKPVTDAVGVTCRGGDCTCHANACYLKCAKNLDCQNGYSCDGTTKLCSPTPCANDADCFSALGKARAKCSAGVCGIPCQVDIDCSPSGDIMGQAFNGTVCGPAGICSPVGCASDTDCSSSTGPRLFCVAPAGVSVHSAVTN